MKYLHVASKIADNIKIINDAIVKITRNTLYSLIEAFASSDFGFHTMNNAAHNIRDYRSTYISPVSGDLFADSGGYSIICGDIHPEDIPHVIEVYSMYFEHEFAYFDFIFSLDIPLSLTYEQLNKKTLIYDLNYESMKIAKNILQANKELVNKFYFVWQFKLSEQFEIWKRFYKELDLGKVVANQAIGGMVGLRRLSKTHYSPFIQMAYYALCKHRNGSFADYPFKLHFLGLNITYDRFAIALLEHLFQNYYGSHNVVDLSYDSVNYYLSGMRKKVFPVYHFSCDQLHCWDWVPDLPQEIVRNVYTGDVEFDYILKEIAQRRDNNKLINSNSLSPFNVYSNCNIDRYFEWLVRDYCLVDVFNKSSSFSNVEKSIRNMIALESKKLPGIYTKTFIKAILINCEMTHACHYWLRHNGLEKKIDEIVQNAIRDFKLESKLA